MSGSSPALERRALSLLLALEQTFSLFLLPLLAADLLLALFSGALVEWLHGWSTSAPLDRRHRRHDHAAAATTATAAAAAAKAATTTAAARGSLTRLVDSQRGVPGNPCR